MKDAPPTKIAVDLVTTVTRMYSLIPRPRLPGEVSLARMRMLAHLCERGPQRIKDLADADQVSQPSVTTMVDALAALGWVERRQDPYDGRTVLVAATPTGRAKLRQRRRARAEVMATHLETLTSEQLKDIGKAVAVLDGLGRHLSEAYSAASQH